MGLSELNQLPFPQNSVSLLQHLEHTLPDTSAATDHGANTYGQDLADEHIFHTFNSGRTPLTKIEELQLLELMCKHFSGREEQVSGPGVGSEQEWPERKWRVFSFLFSNCQLHRMALLGKLTSLSVCLQRKPVLDLVARWMKETCEWSEASRRIACLLVDDFCDLLPAAAQTLNAVGKVSPLFACEIITAITYAYSDSDNSKVGDVPCTRKAEDLPVKLLEIIADWVHDDPALCLEMLQETILTSQEAVDSATCTPVAGLLRWCTVLRFKLLDRHKNDIATQNHVEMLFSKLQLGVLQTMMHSKSLKHDKRGVRLEGYIKSSQFVQVMRDLEKFVGSNGGDGVASSGSGAATKNQVLDDLAQLIQVAKAAGALTGNFRDIEAQRTKLPANRLLDVVVKGET